MLPSADGWFGPEMAGTEFKLQKRVLEFQQFQTFGGKTPGTWAHRCIPSGVCDRCPFLSLGSPGYIGWPSSSDRELLQGPL